MNSVALETFVSLKQTTLHTPFGTPTSHTRTTRGLPSVCISTLLETLSNPASVLKKNKANDQIGESPHATICLLADDCSSSLLASRISTSQ
jgi:hypothetical protein